MIHLHTKKRIHPHFIRAAMLIGLLSYTGVQILDAGSSLAVDAIEPGDPAAADFFVSPDGDDAWSGTFPAPERNGEDGPFATLARAQEAAREAGREEPGALTVQVREGVYPLKEQNRTPIAQCSFGSILVGVLFPHFLFPHSTSQPPT
ncbi:MAG: hypothetical protein WD490_06190 [Opitutales bacterium]